MSNLDHREAKRAGRNGIHYPGCAGDPAWIAGRDQAHREIVEQAVFLRNARLRTGGELALIAFVAVLLIVPTAAGVLTIRDGTVTAILTSLAVAVGWIVATLALGSLHEFAFRSRAAFLGFWLLWAAPVVHFSDYLGVYSLSMALLYGAGLGLAGLVVLGGGAVAVKRRLTGRRIAA